MKKRLLALLFALTLCAALTIPAFAYGNVGQLYDNEELFASDEAAELSSALDSTTQKYELDISIVTTASLNGKTAEEFADDFFDENNLGYGEGGDGVLLMISATERYWHISTHGYGIYAFTDDIIEEMGDDMLPYLSDGDWYGACLSFISDCGYYISAALGEGNREDFNEDDYYEEYYYDYNSGEYVPYENDDGNSVFVNIVIALVIGVVVALIVTLSMKSKMKSVGPQRAARGYVRDGSFELTENRDLYLYCTVTRTPIPRSDDNSHGTHGGFGAGGGFSSTHMSGGGHMHGGGGGRF